MKVVIEKRKDIAFLIKFNPIKIDTQEQIKSIVCSKSLKMLDDAYAKKQVPIADCAKTVDIKKMTDLAKSLGIRAVPTLIMPDGRVQPGYLPADQLISVIDGKK